MMYIADFETTVLPDSGKQTETEVWAFGLAKLFDKTDNVIIGNSIEKFFKELTKGKRKEKKSVYFWNLKFDGSFILSYLLTDLGFKNGIVEAEKRFKRTDELNPGEIAYVITDTGIWYTITVNFDGYIIEFKDGLKLLPYPVKDLSDAFDLDIHKLDMEYVGERHANGTITIEERKYIANDILVPKKALEKFLLEIDSVKNPPLTIAQAALRDYKTEFTKEQWDLWFPNLASNWAEFGSKEEIMKLYSDDEEGQLEAKIACLKAEEKFKNTYGSRNADEYIRKSYYGGWCYVNPNFAIKENGTTVTEDVNSLYPFCMIDDKNSMPIGLPVFTKNKMFLKYMNQSTYFFIRFKCKFSIREGNFPFIQLKYDHNYRSQENLAYSSYDRYGYRRDELRPILTLSSTMFYQFIKCYRVEDFEFLDACYFNTEPARLVFGRYINKWKNKKIEADQKKNKVKRTTAKLFMNSLYGRFGRNPTNIYKVAEENDGLSDLSYEPVTGEDNIPLYIPVASAITSFARCYTVNAANMNYEYMAYSDTDSCHLVIPEGYKPKGMKLHDTELGCWKEENRSEHSIFIRQKTYIEYSGKGEDAEYDIKACGMPERSKMLLAENFKGNKPKAGVLKVDDKLYKLSDNELKFFEDDLTVHNFKQGLSVPGKLLPRLIKGGTILVEVDFTIN